MKRKLSVVFLFLWTIVLSACEEHLSEPVLPAAPDYTQPEAWFSTEYRDENAYDIFYIVPTCVFDWHNRDGDICHYMDTDNPEHRTAVEGPIRLAQGIFADEANLFAPYYRQITIESWMESNAEIESRFKVAYTDIKSAFEHYLQHLNNGRPFVLAGHSQGGKAVIELLKHEMTDELYRRMIAAYPLGYPVREGDTSPYLVPASDASGTGVFITFNSVSSPEKLPPLLTGSRTAINPLNWRTDCTAGTAEQHLGSVFTDTYGNIVSEEAHKISAYLDENTKALVISGVNPEKYYVPALSQLFLPGNYHVVELNFFYRNLQQNVKNRAANYFARQPD